MRSDFRYGLVVGAALLQGLAGCTVGDGSHGGQGVAFLSDLIKHDPATAASEGTAASTQAGSDTDMAGAAPTASPPAAAAPVTPLRGNGYGITDLIDRAQRDSPSLRIKASKIQSAQNQVNVAKLQFIATPSVSVENAVSQNDPYLHGDSTVTVLRVQQPLWTGGRLTSTLRRAKAGVEVSQADLDHERQGVSLSILEKYGQWLSSRLKRRAMQDGEKLYTDLAHLIDRRIDAGASAESDMLMLQSRVDQLRVSINQMQTNEETSIAALSQLIGGPLVASELAEELTGPPVDPSKGPQLIEQARERSPLLRRLGAEVKVADQSVVRARSSLSPEIYVRAQRQYGRQDIKVDEPVDSVFVGVQSQFGAGFSNVLDIQNASYDRDVAKLAIRSGELSLVEQMSSDLAVASSIDERIHNLENAVQSTSMTKDSWDRQFVAGRKTWLDVMNAAREHMDMKVQLAEARATAVIVKWRLHILAEGVSPSAPNTKGQRN